MPATAENNPFWTFSLAVYESPGVAAECLALQDKLGIDVNVLLFCAYLGAVESIALRTDQIDDIQQVGQEWQKCIVRPLRTVRGYLKIFSEQADDAKVAALRIVVKTAELESERLEQCFLWDWLYSRELKQSASTDNALIENLMLLFQSYGSCNSSAPNLMQASLRFAQTA